MSTRRRRPSMCLLSIATALALGTGGTGCDDDENIIAPSIGSLTQRWTIAGAADPAQCTRFGADRMRLVVVDSFGTLQATEFAACVAFQASLTLPVDDYTANATFVNAGGFPVSQTLPIGRFTIFQGQSTTQTIDFPVAAMTPP